ncbi:MAG: mitofilin family membrane protein [Sphingomonadaceae bacterium]|nr:hypothetical protein [Sphingomonadaceae bacterium]
MDSYKSLTGKASANDSRSSLKTLFYAVVIAFFVGAALVAFIAWRTDFGDGAAGVIRENPEDQAKLADLPKGAGATPSASPTSAKDVAEAAQAVERVEEQQGGLDQRLAAAEQRLAKLDLQAQAAAGNAARAEGLLIAFATRRALERGAELGYLADQLRLRFGDAMPNAVRTVVAASRDPITLDQLVARLEGLGPDISNASNESGWARFKRGIDSLFVVRRESAPSPQPERRLDRARMFLESGRVEAAIAEVEQLPGAELADKWIADAKRYAEAQRALDLIETAAVLEPRRLRDGAGNPVEQLSPAGT